jgi:hypothetical protein
LGPRHHVRGRMLAALDMIVQQGLDLGHALADCPYRPLASPSWPVRRPLEFDDKRPLPQIEKAEQ